MTFRTALLVGAVFALAIAAITRAIWRRIAGELPHVTGPLWGTCQRCRALVSLSDTNHICGEERRA